MALKGVKVLEFSGLAPVPFCGMLLADFGASVIRIDKIKGGSELDVLSNGKRSIAVNLKTPQGINIIKQLSKESDVLIEPFRAGVMESLNLSPEVLMKENPKLIYARLTGYGQSGYYHKRAGHDVNYIGLSGILSMFKRVGETPKFPVNFAADFAGGGLTCALGILLALYERTISGKGQVIDSNMVEGAAYVGSWLFRTQKLPIWGNEPGNNILDGGAHFYDVYETKDNKYVSVGAIEPQFYKALLTGLSLTDEEVPQHDMENGRAIFTEKFKEKTQAEWCEIFDKTDGCVFPVVHYSEVPNHRHNKERGTFFVKDETVIPKPAPRLSRTPGESLANQPHLEFGWDTVDILNELGYGAEDIVKLQNEGIVHAKKHKL